MIMTPYMQRKAQARFDLTIVRQKIKPIPPVIFHVIVKKKNNQTNEKANHSHFPAARGSDEF